MRPPTSPSALWVSARPLRAVFRCRMRASGHLTASLDACAVHVGDHRTKLQCKQASASAAGWPPGNDVLLHNACQHPAQSSHMPSSRHMSGAAKKLAEIVINDVITTCSTASLVDGVLLHPQVASAAADRRGDQLWLPDTPTVPGLPAVRRRSHRVYPDQRRRITAVLEKSAPTR